MSVKSCRLFGNLCDVHLLVILASNYYAFPIKWEHFSQVFAINCCDLILFDYNVCSMCYVYNDYDKLAVQVPEVGNVKVWVTDICMFIP